MCINVFSTTTRALLAVLDAREGDKSELFWGGSGCETVEEDEKTVKRA